MTTPTTTTEDIRKFLSETQELRLITSGLIATVIQDLSGSFTPPVGDYAPGEKYHAATLLGNDVYVNPYQSYNDMNIYNEAGEVLFTVNDPDHLLV